MAPGVLFLCVANSARSQLAHALARARFGDAIRVMSAGTYPSRVQPMALRVLEEDKVDTSGLHSKHVDTIDPNDVDLVVTLCAEEVCPMPLHGARRLHWPIEDPAGPWDDPMLRTRFRRAKRAIKTRLDALEAALSLPPATSLMPAVAEDRVEVEALLRAAGMSLPGSAFPAGVAVARLDGHVVGAAGVTLHAERGLLSFVVVAPPHRHKRIGTALVADRLAWAKSLIDGHGQATVASMSVIPMAAERMFERLGFQPDDAGTLTHRFFFTNRELLANGIAAEIAAYGTMVPPFVKYPDIPCMSIGWRMGDGEWYLWMWSTWFNALDPGARAAYLAEWEPKAPDDWVGWMDDKPDDAPGDDAGD